MTSWLRCAAPVAAACLVACGGILASVPDESKGNLPLKVDNEVADKVCVFSMTPQGSTSNVNWLHRVYIFGGAVREFDVKPGTYALRVAGCGDGAYHAEVPALRIDGPTYLTIGRNRVDIPPGFRPRQIAVLGTVADYVKPPPPATYQGGGGPAAPGGEPAGEEPAGEEPAGESSSSSSSGASNPEPAPVAACQASGAICGGDRPPYSNPCCAGTVCSDIHSNGEGWCR